MWWCKSRFWTAITPVSIDHQQYLGETFAEIAGEKAGIIAAAKFFAWWGRKNPMGWR